MFALTDTQTCVRVGALLFLALAVGDRDRVRLHTVEYESEESAGAFSQR